MASDKKLRVLLLPYFATSHIQPFAELAIRLVAASEAVEPTIAVTPASAPIVQSLLLGHGRDAAGVKIATYPFPRVDGIPEGVETLGKGCTADEMSRIHVAAISESVTRPTQEALVRAHSPDAIITDMFFTWNGRVADELAIPCVAFSVMGAFSMLAVRHLMDVAIDENGDNEVPGLPGPRIRIPKSELPLFLKVQDLSFNSAMHSLQASCFGLTMNTPCELEKEYCEMYMRQGYVKRAYFVGPLALQRPPSSAAAAAAAAAAGERVIIDWLDSKPNHSVVYLSFGSLALVKDSQLNEIALGLESSGVSFLWVVRGKDEWSPPAGWEQRVQDQHRGFIIRAWAPQTAILAHPATGAFVTQCGWNSILETVAAGVPVLTWPVFYEQFLTERKVTQVLGIGERLWPDGAGIRSETFEEHEVVPAQDVARALTTFMRPGGPGEMARTKIKDLAAKLHAAVAEGGSSHRDLHRLVDDLMAAAAAKRRT